MAKVYAFPMRVFILVMVFILDVAASVLPAQEKPAPVHYEGRRIAKTMSYHGANWLIRREREQEERTSELLKALDVRPGQVVCDLGCGNGYHALPLAEMVGEKGKVLCVDIQPEMLTLLKKRAKKAGVLDRIEPILATPTDPKLPANSLDLVLMVDVYHEISHPQEVLGHIRRALKPEGRVVFVEFRKEDLSVPIKHEHKMSKQQVIHEARLNGFDLAHSHDALPWQHVLFFQKFSEFRPANLGKGFSWGLFPEKYKGWTLESRAKVDKRITPYGMDVIVSGTAPKTRTPGPITLSVVLKGERVANAPLRFIARARGLRRDPPGWISSPVVSDKRRLVHAGTDFGGKDRSDATWTWPFMRTETTGPGMILMLERTTADEEIQIVQEKDRLTVVGVQHRWKPGMPYAFRFCLMPVKKATDASAIAAYEAWSHEKFK